MRPGGTDNYRSQEMEMRQGKHSVNLPEHVVVVAHGGDGANNERRALYNAQLGERVVARSTAISMS